MMKRERALLVLGAAAMALTILAVPNAAHANSRRHVFKPGDDGGQVVARDTTSDGEGAPEIDGASLGLGIALAAGGLAALTRGRRSDG